MRETHSQMLGDEWLDRATEAVLVVPSVVMPISTATDRNVLINHRHDAAARISISAITPFTLDPRLFSRRCSAPLDERGQRRSDRHDPAQSSGRP